MICISVTPESRTLAKVDLLNAAGQCDLIELCLDKFMKEPNVEKLIDGIDKPVLVSCRRKKDGGHWAGSEEDRIKRLQSAAAANPAYVEIELDIAKDVPRSGDAKRVISYISLNKPLMNFDDIFKQASDVDADIVKFTWPTPTLDDAWPLLATVSNKKNKIPAVGLALGAAGLSFSILGRKYGSPWMYAALEKGMEAYKGQPTVSELDETYSWREIDSKTKFVGIIGFGGSRNTTVKTFNRAFQQLEINSRCLPLEVGKFEMLAKMLNILKITAIVTSRHLGAHILSLADHVEEGAKIGRNADLLLKQDDGWHAHNSIWRSAMKTLEAKLGRRKGEEYPLNARDVLIFGSGRLAQTMAYGIQQRRGLVSITGFGDDEGNISFCDVCGASLDSAFTGAQELAESLDLRYVPFDELSKETPEIVVLADPSLELGYSNTELSPSYLQPSMTVMDVSRLPEESDVITEARQRGCKIVEPFQVYSDQITAQFKSITGEDLPASALIESLGQGS